MVELRLYYDVVTGSVLHYTCEKLEGVYLVVDPVTYAEARPDIKVIDGKIKRADSTIVITKLVPDVTGISCSVDDVGIIVDDIDGVYWSIKNYEFKNS